MSAAKAKGTAAENAVVEYLRHSHWPNAERRALSGANDKGDVSGTPGVVWEVKSGSRLAIPEWMAETERERNNAKADYGVLVIKPKGLSPRRSYDWWAVMPLWQQVELMHCAGY